MKSYVMCAGTDGDPDDVILFGPFDSDEKALSWIKQHANDPAESILGKIDSPEPGSDEFELIVSKRIESDHDHWCENMYTSDGVHTVVHSVVEAHLDEVR